MKLLDGKKTAEDIYIDCKPTGEDGKILYQEDTNSRTGRSNNTQKISAKDFFKSPVTIVVLSLLGAIAIISLIKYIKNRRA